MHTHVRSLMKKLAKLTTELRKAPERLPARRDTQLCVTQPCGLIDRRHRRQMRGRVKAEEDRGAALARS
jgi:hypothetical protein